MGLFGNKDKSVSTDPVGVLSLVTGGGNNGSEPQVPLGQQVAEETVAMTYGNPQWLIAWHRFKSLPPTATNEEIMVAVNNVVQSVSPMVIAQLRLQRQQQQMFAQQMGGMGMGQPGMGGMGMGQPGMGGMGMGQPGMGMGMGMGMGAGMGMGSMGMGSMGMMGMQQQPPQTLSATPTPTPATPTPAATDTPK